MSPDLVERRDDDREGALPDDLRGRPVDHDTRGVDGDAVAAGVAGELQEITLDGSGAVLSEVGG